MAYPPIGGLFICCPQRCRIFVHPPVLSRLLSSHPARFPPLRAWSVPVQDDSPGNPEMFQGAGSEDPWRGQGLCREITAVPRASLAYFVSIFCPRIAGCCADISRNHFRKDTMIIPDQGISSIFSVPGSQAGKNRVFFFAATSHWASTFQEYSPQWPH